MALPVRDARCVTGMALGARLPKQLPMALDMVKDAGR
jgi:hypothetical protein